MFKTTNGEFWPLWRGIAKHWIHSKRGYSSAKFEFAQKEAGRLLRRFFGYVQT